MYIPLFFTVALFIHAKHAGKKLLGMIFKVLSTGIILITALYGMVISPEELLLYSLFICIGIAFGLIGDVVIRYNLAWAMVLFGFGHFSYMAAALNVSKHVIFSILFFILFYLAFFVFFRKSYLSLERRLFIQAGIYAAVILAMLSLTATVPFILPVKGLILFMGAVFFVISDAKIILNIIKKRSNPDIFGLIYYFFGQSLFALSIYMYN